MRAVALFVVLAVLAACGGDDAASPTPTVVDRGRPVPKEVQAFLDEVVDPATVAFVADYHLLNKNGGGEHEIHVTSRPPTLEVTIDGTAVDLTDQASLVPFGIFAGFLSANPKAAIEAAARRADAGVAALSTRPGATDDLECIEIPVQEVVASTWCLHPIGIFGYVDTPSVRYEVQELTAGR
jgi:hypothetical protein